MPPGLLLLHAWPVDARMWQAQIDELGGTVPVVAPQHPGFGGSATAGPVTTMAACADHARSALDEAGVDRAVVCGLSLGGYVAFELWRRMPGRVLGLVLANTRAVADGPEAVASRTELARRLRSEGNVLADELPPLLSDDASPALVGRVREMVADQSAEAVAAASLGMAQRPDSTPDLPRIRVPVLAITSRGDRLIPPEVTAEMAAGIPGARLEVLQDAGHLSNLEDPQGFSALLREHLAACGVG